MNRLGFDLDDVIVEFIPSLIKFHNKKHGKNIKFEDICNYDLWNSGIGKTKEEAVAFVEEFYDSEEFDSIPLIVGAEESMGYLSRNNDLFIITSRSSKYQDRTDAFVKRILPKVPVFYSSGYHNGGKRKAQICDELGLDCFVEDCLKYIREFSPKTKVLIFDKPWNQEITNGNTKRVRNWGEIIQNL